MEKKGCVSGDLVPFINEDQLGQTEQYTILWLLRKNPLWAKTSMHKHTSMHTAAGQAAVENICRGQTPTCQCPSMLCLHSSRESTLEGRGMHSLVLQMQSTEPTKTHIWLRFLSVLASSSSAALEPHQEKTQDLHTELYSMNQLWSQWPTNLLDCSRLCTQLFPVTLSIQPWFDHRLTSCAGFGSFHLQNYVHRQSQGALWDLLSKPQNS